jgi:hypothetical protein
MHGVMGGGGAYVRPVGRDGLSMDAHQLRSQGVGGPEVVGVKITNHGRAPLVIEGVALRVHGGSSSYVPIGDKIGPDLPHRIEPGANASWYTPIDGAKALVSTSREVFQEKVTDVYMTAELGTGKTIKTRNSLRA